MKVCSRCKEEKELEEFCKDKNAKDGKCLWCKECKNEAMKAYYAIPGNRAKLNAKEKIRRSIPEEKAKRNAKQNELNSTPEGKVKRIAAQEKHFSKPGNRAKSIAKQNERRSTPEGKAKANAACKAYDETQKQKRIENLMKTFDKLKSEVSGTIYHFKINGIYKIGKTIYGFDIRYGCKQDRENSTQIIEWIMNKEQMKAFEKIILAKTKKFQYTGGEKLFADGTGNTEVRTNDNEQLIDDLLTELNVDYIKIKR